MPRKKRVWYPGAVYHIVSRGNRKNHLFRDQRDYQFYLDILRKIKEKCGFSLFSYCLMTNHIHLNPVEASIVIKAEAYNRSSYPAYLGLREDDLVNEKPILASFSNDRKLYRKFVESEEINKELDEEIKNECEL